MTPDNRNREALRTEHGEIALFCSIVLLIMAGAFLMGRIGFPTHLLPVWTVVGIGLLLLNVPVYGGARWYTAGSVVSWYGIAALSTAGFLPQYAAQCAGWVTAALGWGLFFRNSIRYFRPGAQKPMTGFALVVGTFCACFYWGIGYANPLFEYTNIAGAAEGDLLLFSSIANMIRTYAIPSTGLDGLPFVHYHFASHWIVARLAPLCGISVWQFYNFAFGVIFYPLLLSTFLEFTTSLEPTSKHRRKGILFWGLTAIGIMGFRLQELGDLWESESQVLGVALSFAVMNGAVCYYREWSLQEMQGGPAQWTVMVLVLPIVLAVCGLAKVSVLFLLLVMLWYVVLRFGFWRQKTLLTGTLVSSLSAIGLSRFTLMGTQQFDPLGAIQAVAEDPSEWKNVAALPGLYLWVFVLMYLVSRTAGAASRHEADLRARRLFSLEILCVCAIAGLLAGLSVGLTGSGGFLRIISGYSVWHLC